MPHPGGGHPPSPAGVCGKPGCAGPAAKRSGPGALPASLIPRVWRSVTYKLKLQLEDLRVDSFDTAPARREKGTVVGQQCTGYTACTCPWMDTCYGSCLATCLQTCHCGSGYPDCSQVGNCGPDPDN